jgi:hypothetical protein
MTPYNKVYDAFMARILEDEWNETWTREEVEADQRLILEAALPWFKFPRVSLEHDENGFSGDLGFVEIQIIANFMKCEWLNRCIMTWENVKPLYVERDFSQANLIDKLKQLLEFEKKKAQEAESIYYRSRNGKPFNFGKLASGPRNDR